MHKAFPQVPLFFTSRVEPPTLQADVLSHAPLHKCYLIMWLHKKKKSTPEAQAVSRFDVFPTNHQYYCFYPFFRIPFCKLSPCSNSLCRTRQFHFPGSRDAHSPFHCSDIWLLSPPGVSKSRPALSHLHLPALYTCPVHHVSYQRSEVLTFYWTDIIHPALHSLFSSPSLLPRSLTPSS